VWNDPAAYPQGIHGDYLSLSLSLSLPLNSPLDAFFVSTPTVEPALLKMRLF
jgi:hypothetical protein